MTEPVDLTNCDREPIHIPGSIQPHGAMLVCDPEMARLIFASRNAATVIGRAETLRRGMLLEEVLGDVLSHDLRNAAAKVIRPELAPVLLGVRLPAAAGLFDVRIHRHEEWSFIEIEPCVDEGLGAVKALDVTQTLVRRIAPQNDVQTIATTGVRVVRAMLGYDRVMVYQFLHNGAGRVIAEAKAESAISFMGQHFPAADIPQQARRLYLVNAIRMISDASYVPIPLEPPLADGEAPVDMSFAQLRSVSPIHCEYLGNMGVQGSLSISIIVSGELWGLIACHHNSPKVVPLALRVAAELFGQCFSLQISVAERRAEILAATEARACLDRILTALTADTEVRTGLTQRLGDIAALLACNGAALRMKGQWSAWGNVPGDDAAQELIEVAAATPDAIWCAQELRAFLPDTVPDIAGAMIIPLSSTLNDYLLLFRNEEAHAIEWAGAPVKTVVTTPHGGRLTPRGSFDTWREEVRGRSTPWTVADRSVAEAIRTYLRDVILRQSEATAEERARIEQRRRILNDELNHRVKNILALVKSIATQTAAEASSVSDYSAALEGRLRALAVAHDQAIGSVGSGSLVSLIETAAGFHRLGGSPERISLSGLPLRLDDNAFGVLALVTHEMMTNAVKYGALSVPEGRLDLRWGLTDAGDCELLWQESGGPRVRRPDHDGFGTKLIRTTIEFDLRGEVEVVYDPVGLRARIIVPGEHVSPDDRALAEPRPAETTTAGALAGLTVLLVEDQALIAMDAEDTLRRLGAAAVHLALSAAEALERLETSTPDLAVLDFNLGSDTAAEVADILVERRVPFIFATGYSDSVMLPARFRGVPIVRKPINDATLVTQITQANLLRNPQRQTCSQRQRPLDTPC
ncbi:MAG TPA: HWE histidine kinase domain-containing protein [Stellaceae bacterium]|jgi:light-regulated signal transduction histidine kinase (bacteriophytochrome)|nr:HWE histidine kinase domain-containing protein [Stellaceae bacterium]